MNTTLRCTGIAALSVACVGFAVPAVAADESRFATTDCKALPGLQRRIVEKADQGVDALRRFVFRTRSVYQLDMSELAQSLDKWRAAARCADHVADATQPRE